MAMAKLRVQLKKTYATNTLRLYQVRFRLGPWGRRQGLKIATLVLLVAILASVFAMPILDCVAGGYFSDEKKLTTLRTLLGSTGTALIGAATIAFSIVVFAMQINVERLPHGLFKKLSSDRRLLGSFLGTFLTALIVAGTSLIPDGSWAIPAIVTAIWGVAAIMMLFLYAYRRALQLINPIEQLAILLREVRRDLQRWTRLADKAAILLREAPQPDTVNNDSEFHFNAPKAHFFQVYTNWTKFAVQAIHYAISYAKRFAEQGDYEVTDDAFKRIMLINAAYCTAKRGTFVGTNPLFELPGTTDGFINASLEQLRQTMQTSLAKGDERLAECTLRAIGGLYGVYLKIEYPGRGRSKHHAVIASGYLGSAVESVIPHNMPDLMMAGIRLMGSASRLALDHTDQTEIVGMAEKIAALSMVGVLKTDHQPVTLTAFEQIADITYDLLTKGRHDIGFLIGRLRLAVTQAAKRFLETPVTSLSSAHNNALGPYFSSTNVSSLRGRLTSVVNQLVEAPADNVRAGEIISNIETWADQMYVPQKELLLLSIQKRSSFTFDVIAWAVGVSELLNALSNAPACPLHLKEDLRKHAVWLISTLSWISEDKDSVTFAENYSITERLFEAGSDGYRRGCLEFYESCKGLLIGWAKKGGRHGTGWGILEASVEGLAALAIREGTPEAAMALKIPFRQMLASEGAPPAEVRARAAANLTRSANQLQHRDSLHSIHRALARQDHATVRTLLLEMAEILANKPPGHQLTDNGNPE